MHVSTFTVSRMPRIDFGAGAIARLTARILEFGPRVVLVTGAASFDAGVGPTILAEFARAGIEHVRIRIEGEPSPMQIDDVVATYSDRSWDVVVGVGGGSALDAAKAIAGLLLTGNSVLDHLEGVGPELPYVGPAIPFIAVPTTAGTGSEATRNAVLSCKGAEGYKKSFRDERLVAEWALVDPDLLQTSSAETVAANGMDAFTQLLESYVSARATPFTDSLAWGGMKALRDGLPALFHSRNDPQARERMAYAALISGITLAQVGLGSVHGVAAPLGAFFPIPHGVACGTLVAEASRINLEALRDRAPHHPAVEKYARVGRLLTSSRLPATVDAHAALLDVLAAWTVKLGMPRLSHYGVTAADVPRIVASSRGSSMKTNPITLNDGEIAALVASRI